MMVQDRALEEVVLTRMVRLNATVQGIVTGIVLGLVIFISTNWLVIKGGPVVGPHLGLLAQFFPGYEVTFRGSLIGCAYGFVVGFVGGSFVAVVYNRVTAWREARGRADRAERDSR
jgi:hypothetical protein